MAEKAEEIWIFAGNRVGDKGAKWHAWVPASDPNSKLMHFDAKGTYSVGSEYKVTVTRADDGQGVTKHGTPVYLRPAPQR